MHEKLTGSFEELFVLGVFDVSFYGHGTGINHFGCYHGTFERTTVAGCNRCCHRLVGCGLIAASVQLGQCACDVFLVGVNHVRRFAELIFESFSSDYVSTSLSELDEFLVRLVPDVLHVCHKQCDYTRVSSRRTNLVFTGNLAVAFRIASRAISSDTPSISNRIRPGRTSNTK